MWLLIALATFAVGCMFVSRRYENAKRGGRSVPQWLLELETVRRYIANENAPD